MVIQHDDDDDETQNDIEGSSSVLPDESTVIIINLLAVTLFLFSPENYEVNIYNFQTMEDLFVKSILFY